VSKYKNFGFQRGARPDQPHQARQIKLQRSLIDGTINRFAGVSQLFWVCLKYDKSRGATAPIKPRCSIVLLPWSTASDPADAIRIRG
jgi:hypothetical protein